MPNTVSGRVVKTRIDRSGWPSTRRSNSAPSLLPIQLRCMVSTRSGQPGSRSHQASSSSRIVRDLEEPAVDIARRDLGIAAPAAAVLHLLVGQHGLTRGAPVDGRTPTIREAALQHPDEDELLPLVVGRVAGRDLAIPVVGDPHLLELRAHVVDVLVGPDDRMHPVLDRRVLGGKPERVPAHRMQDVVAPHPLEARQEIADRVDPYVAHVNSPGRVREHLEAVELRPAGIFVDLELLALFPDPLPLRFDLAERVPVSRHD